MAGEGARRKDLRVGRLRIGAAFLCAAAAAALATEPPQLAASGSQAALARAATLARTCPRLFAPAAEDSILRADSGLSVGRRIGRWTRRFAAADSVRYVFGLSEGGYARAGLIVDDLHVDCVSLLYRCLELARAETWSDAVAVALSTRFAGAPWDSLVDDGGRVDYDRPEHLDFSLDMIRSGRWGLDVTAGLQGAVPDAAGSARYPAGAFLFVPSAALKEGELREGDVAWFVLQPDQPLRRETGAVIGHIGIIVEQDDLRLLVHAASSDLAGHYSGGRVVSVPLREYLARVPRFCGVIVTRIMP